MKQRYDYTITVNGEVLAQQQYTCREVLEHFFTKDMAYLEYITGKNIRLPEKVCNMASEFLKEEYQYLLYQLKSRDRKKTYRYHEINYQAGCYYYTVDRNAENISAFFTKLNELLNDLHYQVNISYR